ncbi:MAG: hypothetical protein CVU47_01540 [Chloroflexi bacterium HGW-Chloroflexi-9]|nr:MAG: hypothetical protein CVU47_01540 [Chloroflexi bacterium HGW-Chloroflexi-9]
MALRASPRRYYYDYGYTVRHASDGTERPRAGQATGRKYMPNGLEPGFQALDALLAAEARR